MDILILTGGYGRHLGALTALYPKAKLRFCGKSLLSHTLASISETSKKAQKIFVATGYRSETVECFVKREVETYSIKTPVVVLLPEKQLTGTFGSTVWGLKTAGINGDCLVTGVDVIVTETAISDFLVSAQEKQATVFLISSLLSVAPTHGMIRLREDGQIAEYRKSSAFSTIKPGSGWYSDVGIRYLSTSFINECRHLTLCDPCDFDDIMPNLVHRGFVFKTQVLRERWLHFGVSKDFGQEPLATM